MDFGGGSGVFSPTFQEHGVSRVALIDILWVDHRCLLIDEEAYFSADLAAHCNFGTRFDLVIALETAEHLEPEFAEIFVRTLVDHSNLILFSTVFKEFTEIAISIVNDQVIWRACSQSTATLVSRRYRNPFSPIIWLGFQLEVIGVSF